MELSRLIEALSEPSCYPEVVDRVEVRQTHISVVFLAGSSAYKVKKPVSLGFLDFSTADKRRHFCEREVVLNRRLAPTVYRGVVAIARDGSRLQVEGPGEAVEWAVKMDRLPDSATLQARLRRGEIQREHLDSLAHRIAAFHARAEGGPTVAAFGRFEVVAGNARENFDQSAGHVGMTVSRSVYERLRQVTESTLAELRPLIERRAARGVPRDGHGDLRLNHVYLFPDRAPPSDLAVIDCIEFNDRFRCADPVADMAFIAMELAGCGRWNLSRSFADSYFEAAGDDEGRALLPFYTAYRAAVRAKVEGIEFLETEVPESERTAAQVRARAQWLLALGELEEPDRRPCLVLVCGLPGSGKSTLARGLAEWAAFTVIRSDLVRKELTGSSQDTGASSAFEGGIYTPAWTERTYAECLRRAESGLFEGERVLIDASFRTDVSRLRFLEAAARWSVPALFLLCRAEPEIGRARLEARRDDASDADWSIYRQVAARWEEPGPLTLPVTREIATGGNASEALELALGALREADKGILP